MRRFVVVLCFLGFTPLTAFALGLGDIELESALNQPFSAEIPLESYEQDDLKSLQVGLASADTFERYGLDLPVWMQGFEFAVATDSGSPVITISSQRPVSEPFVTLLLDIKWSSGRLLREYTVLLDPPLFEPAPVQATVTPAETAPVTSATASESAGTVTRSVTPPARSPAPVAAEQPATSSTPTRSVSAADSSLTTSQPVSQPSSQQTSQQTSQSAPLTGTDYSVRRRDTLWGIAERVRGDSDMTVNQVMLALYRANPEAFLGNINRLKAGVILRVPDAPEITALSPGEATAQVRQQNAALKNSSGSAAAAAPEPATEPAQLTLVPPATEASDSSAATSATTAGQTGGSDAATGQMQNRIDQLEGELSESRRLLEARDAELAAMQRRLAAAEAARESAGDVAILDEVAVEDDLPLPADSPDVEAVGEGAEELAADELTDDTPFADEVTDESTAELTDDAAEEAGETVDDAASTVVAGATPEESSSLLSNVWFWLSAAIVVLLALFVARRRKSDEDDGLLDADGSGSWEQQAVDADHEETMRDLESLPSHDASIVVEESAGGIDDPEQTAAFDASSDDLDASLLADADKTSELQLPDEGDVETPLEKTISTGGLVDLDQADPIAEADFHMAYGLYDQAAELLERSLANESDNRDYRVKLIEVFFVWENREGFLTHARAFRDAVTDDSDADWNKVVILGKQLCPEDDLFSGSSAAAPTADSMDFELTEMDEDAGDAEVDFTLGKPGDEVEALDEDLFKDAIGEDSVDESTGDDNDLDFDLGGDDDSADDLALDLGEDDLGDDSDDSATTMESPTVEADMSDSAEDTLETPTIESPAVSHSDDDSEVDVDFDLDGELLDDNAATMETPTIETDMNEATLESPTLESAADGGGTAEMPALDADSFDDGEIDLDLGGSDDLDVDLSGLGDEPEDGDTETRVVGDDDATLLATPGLMGDGAVGEDDETLISNPGDLEAEIEAELEAQASANSDAANSDTVEQPQIDPADVELGETAEQPAISDSGDVDFDLGMEADAEDDVATAIQEASLPEDATMTEVGTKLDLARAYIDMGDPDGARSILNEVLDEGGQDQQQEARQLLEELGD